MTETGDRISWTWRGEAGYALVQRQVLEALMETVNDRARARDIAVQLEQENHLLTGFLDDLRYDLNYGKRLLTIEDITARITTALAQVTP